MRLRAEPSVAVFPAAMLVAALLTTALPAASAAERVSAEQVEAAASALPADPRLHGGGKTERVLRFKPSRSEPDPPDPESPGLLAFIRWLAEAMRALAWVLGAVLLAIVVVVWRRWLQVRADAAPRGALAAPSHVRDLDIRPDSLPADIGSAARALWQRGDPRGALSLLYRGALSRLVHVHAVPIEAASTEGECIALARAALPAASGEFVAQLIGTWQRAVYGDQLPPTDDVMALCDAFDARLSPPAPSAPPAAAAAAA